MVSFAHRSKQYTVEPHSVGYEERDERGRPLLLRAWHGEGWRDFEVKYMSRIEIDRQHFTAGRLGHHDMPIVLCDVYGKAWAAMDGTGSQEVARIGAPMTTLRIYDLRDGVLALDLRDLIDLLAPRSLEAGWTVSPVRLDHLESGRSFHEFMITGPGQPGQDKLELIAASGSSVSGATLSEAAQEAAQVIWGQFAATLPEQSDPWVVIRAIDSTFYEVTSSDDAVLNAVQSAYVDVRVACGPATATPIEGL